jgi:DsbC/DsbD-like thiol-disulfide interchange protein
MRYPVRVMFCFSRYRFKLSRPIRVSFSAALLAGAMLAGTMVVGNAPSGAAGVQPPAYEAPHTRIRLLPGGTMAGPDGSVKAIAGIEITLETGWKTYWRSPGEGIAPSFSWDESVNLKSAEVLWPAPVRFVDPEGASIGYKGRLLLPLLISAEKAGEPVSLNLAIAYGVCKDICMPVEAQLSLDMDTPVRPRDREDLLAAMTRVPQKQGGGTACPHRFLGAWLSDGDSQPVLRVETAFDRTVNHFDVMVEAAPEAGLGVPKLSLARPFGRSAYLFPVPPEGVQALREKPLVFTTVSDKGSCESTSPVK